MNPQDSGGTVLFGQNISITDITLTISSVQFEDSLLGTSSIYAEGNFEMHGATVVVYSNIFAFKDIYIDMARI